MSDRLKFGPVEAPNYTNTPNIIFDKWLPFLNCIQLKVLMVICRKTFGWHRHQSRISLKELEQSTGSHRKHILIAINFLIENNIIEKVVCGNQGYEQTFYNMVIQEVSNNSDQLQKATPPSCKKQPPYIYKEKDLKKEDFKALKSSEKSEKKDFKVLKNFEKSENPKASPFLVSLQLSHEATNKLKQFPDEAISYAITSHSLMKDKPKDSIPILISLCKRWLERKAETTKKDLSGAKKILEELYNKTPELKLLVRLDGENFKLEFGDICVIFQHDQENLHDKIIEAICKIDYRTQKMQR